MMCNMFLVSSETFCWVSDITRMLFWVMRLGLCTGNLCISNSVFVIIDQQSRGGNMLSGLSTVLSIPFLTFVRHQSLQNRSQNPQLPMSCTASLCKSHFLYTHPALGIDHRFLFYCADLFHSFAWLEHSSQSSWKKYCKNTCMPSFFPRQSKCIFYLHF